MKLCEAVILIVVILLVVGFAVKMHPDLLKMRCSGSPAEIAVVKSVPESEGFSGSCSKSVSDIEKEAIVETMTGGEPASTGVLSECDYVHDVQQFFAGGEYKDWVMDQSVDPQVVKNHHEFVKDRTQNRSQNVLGRTWSPDSHDSSQMINWIGIRGRPQAVPIGNPDQMPDVDLDWYAKKPKISWDSS